MTNSDAGAERLRMMKLLTRHLCILMFLCIAFVNRVQAQVHEYVVYPRYDTAMTWMGLVGASVTFVPRPIAEEEIRQIPFVDGRLRCNVYKGLTLGARAGTNYLTSLATLSAQWMTPLGPFDLALGDEEMLWYGRATMDEFDVHAIGYINSPNVTIGFATSDFLLSIRADLQLLTYRTTRVGDQEIASDRNQRLGASLGITIEQPYAHSTHLLLGLKVYSLRNAYQSWLAFSTFNDPLLYPELSIGLIL